MSDICLGNSSSGIIEMPILKNLQLTSVIDKMVEKNQIYN